MAKKEAVEKKEKKKKSFMSRLLKFLLIFIIFLIVLLVAVCLIPYFLWKVNVINVVKDLRVLNQKVDESKIVTNAYSESDLESAKKIFDVKIIDSKEYSISDKEICAYINDQIENDKVDLSAFNEFGDKIEIRQIEFTIPSEGIDYLAKINTVLQIDLSDVKASWDFPKSLMTNFIPSKIYISTTAKVEKDTTSESGYEYKVSTLDFCVNNLNNNQTSEFLEAVDLVTNVATAEEYGNQISKIVVDSLIGNTENKGLFYTLKNLSSYYEVKSYSFKQVDGKNCFAILTNVDYDYVINYNGLTEEQEQTLNHGASNKEDWTLSTNVKKVGYTCSWYEDEEFTKEITVIAKDESRTGVVQVYAKFTPNKYTVEFKDSDDKQIMSDLKMTYDVGQYLPKNTFTKSEAYTFAYWTYENDERKTCELADGAWAINLTAENERKVTLTAKWVAREYTITYDTNGGTISGDYKTTYMIVSEVDLPTPTKTGYDFKGWNDGKTEITKIVKGRYGNIALMAVWEATQYTITYDTNGKTVDTSNYIASYTIETNFTLPTAKCAGYDFDGWKIIEISGDTNFDESVIYNNENLTGKYGSVKFQAQWTPRIYTITYDTNGKMADTSNYMASYTIETNFTLPTAECVGYDFGGWKIIEISGDTNFDESVTYKNENLTGKYGSVKFQAQWTPHSYTITYDTNGKTVDTSNYIASYTIETNFTLPTAKCAGYDFDGWKIIEISGDTNFDTSVIYNNENLTGKYGSVKFQAQWTPRIYTITYDTNGKMADIPNYMASSYTIETNFTLPTAECVGYDFGGWKIIEISGDTNFDESVTYKNENLTGKYGSVKFQAQWTPHSYTITYDTNGKLVDTSNYIASYTIETNFTLPTAKCAGYDFDGWKIIEISGDTNFDESVIYNNENLTGKYGSVKFQAQWTPRIYTITLAEVDTATSYTYTITSQTLSIENPTRSSKGFETWSIDWSDSDHSDVLPTVDITIDTTTLNLQANTYGNITLTASWCNTCNVNLVVDGATFLLSQVKVDSVYTLPTGDLSGNGYGGYTIEGWYEDENLTTSCSSSQTITKNINFYAKSKYIVGYTNEIQSFYDYEDTVDVDEILKNKLVTVKNDTELRAWIAYVMFYHVTEEVRIKFDYEYKTEEITTPEGKIRQIFDEDGTLITKYKIGSNEAGNGVFCYASTDDNYSVYNSSSDKIYQQQNYAYAMTGTTTTRDFKVDKIGKICNVSTSLQLVYALEYGYRPICETGSNAEIVYNKAKAVLAEICTDDMDNVTKMRAIYEWLALNVNYDYDVAEATGIDARNWDSWAVEGVFNSKKAVCEGYAKAFLVMARIEGIPALYVTGNGHAWNRVYINGAWYGVDATHADVGVADKGLEVFTYKEFLFTDAYKTSRGYTSTNFANYEAKTTYNTYTNIGNGTTFDLQIDGDVNGVQKYTNALDEFKAFYNTVSSTIASTKTTYATIEVSVTNPEIGAGDLLGAITNFSSSYSANTISVVADVNGNNVITLLISKKSA